MTPHAAMETLRCALQLLDVAYASVPCALDEVFAHIGQATMHVYITVCYLGFQSRKKSVWK